MTYNNMQMVKYYSNIDFIHLQRMSYAISLMQLDNV
jgi:hypothetical protein